MCRFSGRTCELDVDECYIDYPCAHATCVNTYGGYYCECHYGYKGIGSARSVLINSCHMHVYDVRPDFTTTNITVGFVMVFV